MKTIETVRKAPKGRTRCVMKLSRKFVLARFRSAPARGRSVRPPRRAPREQLGRPFLQRCTTGFDHIRAWLAVWLAESTVDLLGG